MNLNKVTVDDFSKIDIDLNSNYMVRHIIYDISPEEDMSSIKEKYYKDYCKTDTDTFYLCESKQEIDELLKKVMNR